VTASPKDHRNLRRRSKERSVSYDKCHKTKDQRHKGTDSTQAARSTGQRQSNSDRVHNDRSLQSSDGKTMTKTVLTTTDVPDEVGDHDAPDEDLTPHQTITETGLMTIKVLLKIINKNELWPAQGISTSSCRSLMEQNLGDPGGHIFRTVPHSIGGLKEISWPS